MPRHLPILLLFLYFGSRAQSGNYSFGARSAGLAGTSVTLGDEWSVFNNAGGIGRVDDITGMVGYRNRNELSELQIVGGGIIIPTKYTNAGISFFRYGDDLFNEQKAAFVLGNKIQMVSLGLGINLLQYTIEGLETRRKVAIDFGGVVELTPQFVIGAHLFNFREQDLVPTVMKAGISYRPTDKLSVNAEVEKDLDFDEVFKAAVEYFLIESVAIRTGINTRPFRSTFGAGWKLRSFVIDYAFTDDSNLGGIHDLSLAYRIKSK